jgi:hypothetical protein
MIEELITAQIKEKNSLKNKKREGKERTWYASSLGSCLRGQYFQRLGVEIPEFSDRELRVFDVGNKFEDWLIELIKKSGKEIQAQDRLYSKKWDISGRPDLIMDGKVYEIKSKNSKAFWYMTKEGKPMRQHEQQIWFYLKMLDLPVGNIVYLSKDDLAIQEFEVRLDDKELEKEVVKQLVLLNRAWKEQDPSILPLPNETDWQAKFCRCHLTHCTKLNDNLSKES